MTFRTPAPLAIGLALCMGCHPTYTKPDLADRAVLARDYATIAFGPATFHDVPRTDVVTDVVRKATELRYCYDRQRHRDPSVGSGEIEVSLDIGADGGVRLVDVEDRGVDANVALCLASRLRGMQFAPSDRTSTRVSLPIQLSHTSEAGA